MLSDEKTAAMTILSTYHSILALLHQRVHDPSRSSPSPLTLGIA